MGNRPMDVTPSATDVESVTAVATEYFQSWFAGDGERMRACLHPLLAKRTPLEPALLAPEVLAPGWLWRGSMRLSVRS
jgi:hypothetical protein